MRSRPNQPLEMMSLRRVRHFQRLLLAITILVFLYVIYPGPLRKEHILSLEERQEKFPLFWKHVHLSKGSGGAWYIPPSWLAAGTPQPTNLVEAAWLAAKIANQTPNHRLKLTAIPSIVHQTWWGTEAGDFSEKSLEGIEKWLHYAIGVDSNMAYFMWTDASVTELIGSVDKGYDYGGKKIALVELLPKPVEIADVFRVVVCNTIGGVYADIDTIPLRAPVDWVSLADTRNWTDPVTNIQYGQHGSSNTSFASPSPIPAISLILGIEADNVEYGDAYWRMGYTYPVQLTQWALAASPKQPILSLFLDTFHKKVQEALRDAEGTNTPVKHVMKQDPLELTGPVAITNVTRQYLEQTTALRWQALSGIEDGGRSKVVLDTLILPITGFSPGRGRYGNMGSKALTDVDARVQHAAQGSWRSFNMKVEMGKACRTILGACKDWSKVPE